VKWVTLTRRLGNLSVARALQQTVPINGDLNRSEADMRQMTTINGHHGNHYVEATAFWILAGIIVVLAFGDFLTLLAGAFAIAIAITWVYRGIERGWQRNDARTASVSHLRPVPASPRDLKNASAHVSWDGPRAA
jgi:hypothetical protein